MQIGWPFAVTPQKLRILFYNRVFPHLRCYPECRSACSTGNPWIFEASALNYSPDIPFRFGISFRTVLQPARVKTQTRLIKPENLLTRVIMLDYVVNGMHLKKQSSTGSGYIHIFAQSEGAPPPKILYEFYGGGALL